MTSIGEMGPNVRRLYIHKMSLEAVPAGGGFAEGLTFFTDKDKRQRIMRDAEIWVMGAIQTVRTAAEPNPWREAGNEAIAGEILRRMDERKAREVGQ